MSEPLDSWFRREILVHEEALVRFIRRHWRNPNEAYDLRQETYARVLEAAAVTPPHSPKAFLFATARHLITDRIRRQQVITIDTIGDLETLHVAVDNLSPERYTAAYQELRVVARAFDNLPAKCREILWLRRVERLSQVEIATQLGISQKTVEGHLTKGLRRLGDALFGNQVDGSNGDSTAENQVGRSHGQSSAD